jgi:hypothetical protein
MLTQCSGSGHSTPWAMQAQLAQALRSGEAARRFTQEVRALSRYLGQRYFCSRCGSETARLIEMWIFPPGLVILSREIVLGGARHALPALPEAPARLWTIKDGRTTSDVLSPVKFSWRPAPRRCLCHLPHIIANSVYN